MKYNFKQTALKLALVSAFALGAAGLGVNSYAAVGTTSLGVTASIAVACSISTSTVAFGIYEPVVANLTAALDGTGTVNTICTNGAAIAIALDEGSFKIGGSTAAVPLRQMASGADRLAYFLYSDSARSVVWGNTTETDVNHAGIGTAETITVYGRVTGGQNKPAGVYNDTVIVTVTF